jgi:hypothetical protein
MDELRIDELPAAIAAEVDHLLPAMRGGETKTLSIAQISALITALLVDSAPATLDTLNELAAALGDDPDFATTVTNALAAKLALAGGTMTGDIDLDGNGLLNVGSITGLSVGKVVQRVSATPYNAWTAITSVIPGDDTVPQSSEGTEVLSVAITPTNAANKIVCRASINGTAIGTPRYVMAAIFKSGSADAIRTGQATVATDLEFNSRLMLNSPLEGLQRLRSASG